MILKSTSQGRESLRLLFDRWSQAKSDGEASRIGELILSRVLHSQIVRELLDDVDSLAAIEAECQDRATCIYCQQPYDHENHYIGGSCISFTPSRDYA